LKAAMFFYPTCRRKRKNHLDKPAWRIRSSYGSQKLKKAELFEVEAVHEFLFL